MDLSLGRLLTKRASMEPNKIAFKAVEADTAYTFSQYNERTNQTANLLLSLGVGKGDRVGIFMMNSPEFVEIFFACAKIGAICVPINWRLSIAEVDYIANDAGIKVLIYGGEFSELVTKLLNQPESQVCVEHTLCHSNHENDIESEFIKLREQHSKQFDLIDGWNEDLCLIMYTSGTTGHPKGVMHSHKSMMWALITMSGTMQTNGNERFITAMPLFHVAALLPVLLGVYEGFTLLCVKKFDPSAFWQQIETEQATSTLLAPVMMNFLLQVPETHRGDHTSLKWVMAGAAPVPVSLITSFQQMDIAIHQVYGMTESAGPACLITGDNAVTKIGSAGKGFLHTEIRVVNADGEDVQAGETGEVLVSGAHMMHGYWNLPDKTAEVIKDGWYYSGDAARIDSDGFIYIVDRIKDMIISGGENIYPAEIEAAIITHPSVSEVAVVGKTDETWDEIPVAFICSTDNNLTQESIEQHLEDKLAKFKQPKFYYFIDILPRNPSGKILKTELRAKLKRAE